MRNTYEINQILFYLSELKYSFEEGLPRKKRSNKLMEKRYRRSKHCFGHNRVCRASVDIRSRKKGWKINYEPKYGCIVFDENIIEGTFNVTPPPQINIIEDETDELMAIKENKNTKDMFSLYELMGDIFIKLPEELLIDILSRLPVQILAHFECVPKLWRRVISKLPVTNTSKLLIFAHSKNKEISFNSVDNEANVMSVCSPVEERLLQNHVVNPHSSCHGLLLIQIDNDLFIWNPLSNFFKKVLTIREFIQQENSNFYIRLDLCYCSVSEEYKVMLMVHSWSNYPSNTREFYIATCGASSWEKIENVNFEDLVAGPFFKGYRHWSCSSNKQVVYFDPSTNKFIEVAMPQRKDEFLYLGVFDQCLCITRCDDPESYDHNLELVVMKEYGNGNSWEVTFVFLIGAGFCYYGSTVPLFRTKNGEVVVSECRGCNCCYGVETFDVHGNYLRHIMGWSLDDYDGFSDILYEESWHSPTDMKTIFYKT